MEFTLLLIRTKATVQQRKTTFLSDSNVLRKTHKAWVYDWAGLFSSPDLTQNAWTLLRNKRVFLNDP